MFRVVAGLIALLLFQSSLAQENKNESYYVFDKDWKGTVLNNGVYFLRVRKLGDKEFLWTTYQMYGPRISQEVFQDEAGQLRNGYCRYYHPNGQLDSNGTCENNLPGGEWWYYNTDGKTIRKKEYNKGILVKDSVIVPAPDDTTRNTKLDPGEVESSFKGGLEGWRRFLNRNFRYPDRAINARKEGTVMVQFIVDEEGIAFNPEIIKSVEYSLDEESIRMINIAPNWNPAFRNGLKVKSYKRQPVIFRLTN